MKKFMFELGQSVSLVGSGELGIVVGRAEYEADSNQYYVRGTNAQGCQFKNWFNDTDIQAV